MCVYLKATQLLGLGRRGGAGNQVLLEQIPTASLGEWL